MPNSRREKVKIAAGEFVPPEERQRRESLGPQPARFESFALDEFLPWSQAQHSARHHTRLANIIRVHLLPYFEKRYLHEITPKLIEDYKALRHRGLQPPRRQKVPSGPGH